MKTSKIFDSSGYSVVILLFLKKKIIKIKKIIEKKDYYIAVNKVLVLLTSIS